MNGSMVRALSDELVSPTRHFFDVLAVKLGVLNPRDVLPDAEPVPG